MSVACRPPPRRPPRRQRAPLFLWPDTVPLFPIMFCLFVGGGGEGRHQGSHIGQRPSAAPSDAASAGGPAGGELGDAATGAATARRGTPPLTEAGGRARRPCRRGWTFEGLPPVATAPLATSKRRKVSSSQPPLSSWRAGDCTCHNQTRTPRPHPFPPPIPPSRQPLTAAAASSLPQSPPTQPTAAPNETRRGRRTPQPYEVSKAMDHFSRQQRSLQVATGVGDATTADEATATTTGEATATVARRQHSPSTPRRPRRPYLEGGGWRMRR